MKRRGQKRAPHGPSNMVEDGMQTPKPPLLHNPPPVRTSNEYDEVVDATRGAATPRNPSLQRIDPFVVLGARKSDTVVEDTVQSLSPKVDNVLIHTISLDGSNTVQLRASGPNQDIGISALNEACFSRNPVKLPDDAHEVLPDFHIDISGSSGGNQQHDRVLEQHIESDDYDSRICRHYKDDDEEDSVESADEGGIIAIGIPARPITPDIDQDTGSRNDDEKEQERPSQTNEDADQEAVSAVVALNVAETEHNTMNSKKTHINQNDSVSMVAMIRTPTTVISPKEAKGDEMLFPRKKNYENAIGCSSSKSGELLLKLPSKELSVATPLTAKSDELAHDDEVGSPAYRLEASEDHMDEEFTTDSTEHSEEIEAQAGIPVVLPGAFAMIGMDNVVGRHITGYDSGFDGEESNTASSGILEPPALPEEEMLHFEQDEHVVEQSENSMAVEGIEAELHEERHEIFVEGQVLIDAELDTGPKAAYKRRFVQFLIFSAIVGTTAIVAVVVINIGRKQGSNLRGADAIGGVGPKGWTLLSDLVGPTDNNRNFFGQSISLSSDGKRLVVGVPGFDVSIRDTNVGQARLFDWNGQSWELSQSIDGPSGGSAAGSSVAMSRDGKRAVIGSPLWADGIGQVGIYMEPTNSSISKEWPRVGEPILGNSTNDSPTLFGTSVAMSWDGTILAVSAPYAKGTAGVNAGIVRVYKETESVWVQVGSDLEGETVSGVFGSALALASSGSRIVVGSPFGIGSRTGLVRTFDLEGDMWTIVGQILAAPGDASTVNYGYSVSLSDNGSILAVGALGFDQSTGVVQVYRMVDNQWTGLGEAITGPNPSIQFGQSISLSAGGDIIAIGSPKGSVVVASSGEIVVFKYDGKYWVQLQGAIGGTAEGDAFGSTVALSGQGEVVVGGAPNYNYDGIQSNVGNVKIYKATGA